MEGKYNKMKTYNECYNGSVRKAVAEFIDASPLLNNFKGVKYYELEDSIVDLIRNVTKYPKEKKTAKITRTVYMVLFDWSTDDADGIETFLFYDYDAAYLKFKNLVADECNPELSWVGSEALTVDNKPNDGYLLDYYDNNSEQSEVYFHVAREDNYYFHSFIDLIKKEIIL